MELTGDSLLVLNELDRVYHGEESDTSIVSMVNDDNAYSFVIHTMDHVGMLENRKRFKDCQLAKLYVNRLRKLNPQLYEALLVRWNSEAR